MKTSSTVTVKAWQLEGILLEKYSYTIGAVEPLPKHSHQEYQLGLSFNCQGEYFYRGAYHLIPIGNLSIIHSGEVHSPSERTYLPKPATFWMMHVDPNVLKETALEIGNTASVPFFTEPALRDRNLNKLFQNLCIAINTNATRLVIDSLILEFFSCLIAHQTKLSAQNYQTVKPAITIVCDFLQAHYPENISLAKLSEKSGKMKWFFAIYGIFFQFEKKLIQNNRPS